MTMVGNRMTMAIELITYKYIATKGLFRSTPVFKKPVSIANLLKLVYGKRKLGGMFRTQFVRN